MQVAKSGPTQELEAEQVMDGDEHQQTEKNDSLQHIYSYNLKSFPVFTSDSTLPISFQTKTQASSKGALSTASPAS